jgi:hypothetical protein
MSPQRIVGIVLLVVGVVILIMGMNASNSATDKISNTFTGHFTDHTTWMIVGGIAAGLFGLLLSLFGGGKTA